MLVWQEERRVHIDCLVLASEIGEELFTQVEDVGLVVARSLGSLERLCKRGDGDAPGGRDWVWWHANVRGYGWVSLLDPAAHGKQVAHAILHLELKDLVAVDDFCTQR